MFTVDSFYGEIIESDLINKIKFFWYMSDTSAVLISMNLTPMVVSWFYKSRFCLKNMAETKTRKGLWPYCMEQLFRPRLIKCI